MMRVFRRLTLNDDRVGYVAYDPSPGQQIGGDQMFQGGDKTLLSPEAFVPAPVPAAIACGHIDFIYRSIRANPWVTLRDRAGIPGEMQGHLRILKISHPVRHAEMQQIKNRAKAQPPDFTQ